jgi:hypothetical protein
MTAARKPSQTTPAAAPKPTPPAAKPAVVKPAAPAVDLGETLVKAWFPSIKLASGTVVKCPHSGPGKYGHENAKTAERCARSLINRANQSPAVLPAAVAS